MSEYFDCIKIHQNLGGIKSWKLPYEFIPNQWVFDSRSGTRIIVSCAPYPTGDEPTVEWLHASISRREMPTYEDLVKLHKAVFNDGWAYQIFTPVARHINIHSKALHLFGRLDGKMIHPDFQTLTGINSI